MTYAIVMSLHVGSVIAWMSAMLVAPILIVVLGRMNGTARKEAAVRARGYIRWVSTPGILAAWSLGVALLVWGDWIHSPWMIAKLVAVVALSALHGALSGRLRRIETDDAYRPANAITVLIPVQIGLVFLIAALVVVKPI